MEINISILILLGAAVFLAFFGDLLHFALRFAATTLGKMSVANHLGAMAMLLNRIGAAVGMLILGWCLDSGIAPQALSFSYAVSLLTLAFSYEFFKIKHDSVSRVTAGFIAKFYKLQSVGNSSDTQYQSPRPISEDLYRIDMVIIYLMSIVGFLGPALLASNFLDFRATLLQTGFIFNTIATIYSTLVIEKELAVTLELRDPIAQMRLYKMLMRSRALASLAAACVFLYFSQIA